MARSVQTSPSAPVDPDLIAPTAERWQAMTEAERAAFLERSLAALQREAELMPEGRPHITAKMGVNEVLRDWFARIGRRIYLASELPVHYPGERIFAPDLMAVLDVEDTGYDDERMAWVVAREGRGLDLVMEILHAGDPHKDLYDNVVEYARLGIPEYFVYDRRRQRVVGYRLPRGGGRYEQLRPRGGLLSSRVLGLELGIVDNQLRFSTGGAEIPETRELLGRVNALVDGLERKAEAETAARLEAERRAEAANARAEEAERRAEAEAAARSALELRLAELLARTGGGES